MKKLTNEQRIQAIEDFRESEFIRKGENEMLGAKNKTPLFIIAFITSFIGVVMFVPGLVDHSTAQRINFFFINNFIEVMVGMSLVFGFLFYRGSKK